MIDISTKLDLEKFAREIRRASCSEDIKYLIMSCETAKELTRLWEEYFPENNLKEFKGCYDNIPIALCNELKFGEVDII